jgi:hypothetical protein
MDKTPLLQEQTASLSVSLNADENSNGTVLSSSISSSNTATDSVTDSKFHDEYQYDHPIDIRSEITSDAESFQRQSQSQSQSQSLRRAAGHSVSEPLERWNTNPLSLVPSLPQWELDEAQAVATAVHAHGPAPDIGKFGNPRLRFTILYAILIMSIATLPLWAAAVFPGKVAAWIDFSFIALVDLMWITIAVCAIRNYNKLLRVPIPPLQALAASRVRKFRHIVVVPCYMDPLDVMFDCLGSLVLQSNPKDLLVVVTFERKTPDLMAKRKAVDQAFHRSFGDLLIVVHTLKPDREIPGGCSNKNFALHSAYEYTTRRYGDRDSVAHTITTCDTDSRFHPSYFEALEAEYNAMNPILSASVPPKYCVWQPPTFYNWDLDQRPFFNRITGLMRTMMMLGGLISFSLNSMSIFSYPLELGLKVGMINPRYGVDDIIGKVRWMIETGEDVPVKLLPVPVISGPTIGVTFMDEVWEWGRQIRRWIIGSSESFHYFVIHWRGTPLFFGLRWITFFFMYYAVLLCCGGILGVLASLPLPWADNYDDWSLFGSHADFSLGNVCLASLIIQYIVFGVAFIIDYFAVRNVLTIHEDISIFRNLAHWIASPIVLMVYSIIAFISIVRFVWSGKKLAGHDMAAKEGLKADTNLTSAPPALVVTNSSVVTEAANQVPQLNGEPIEIAAADNDSDASDSKYAAEHEQTAQLPSRIAFGAFSAFTPDLHNQRRRRSF